MVHQPAHTKTEHAFNPEAPVAQHINAFFIFNVVTLLWLLEIVPSGADGGASAEASGPATQKALPPWMLRQGITSTTTAPGGQPLGAPLMQANGASVGSSNDGIASEKDQKAIEVSSGQSTWEGLSAGDMCSCIAIQTCKRLRMWYSNIHSICAAWACGT